MAVQMIHKDALFSGLTAKQQAALPCLLKGMTTEQVGKVIKIAPTTISNWRGKDQNFRDCEDRMRRQALEDARLALRALAGKAIKAFEDSLDSDNARIRFESAKHLIDRLGLIIPADGEASTTDGVDLNKLFAVLGVKGAVQ